MSCLLTFYFSLFELIYFVIYLVGATLFIQLVLLCSTDTYDCKSCSNRFKSASEYFAIIYFARSNTFLSLLIFTLICRQRATCFSQDTLIVGTTERSVDEITVFCFVMHLNRNPALGAYMRPNFIVNWYNRRMYLRTTAYSAVV